MEFHLLDLLFYLILCIPFYIWNKKQNTVSWEGGIPFVGWFFMTFIYTVIFWHCNVIDFFSWISFSL